MIPFESVAAVNSWFLDIRRPVSVLVDFTSIGVGNQKRTLTLQRGLWILGFPGVSR